MIGEEAETVLLPMLGNITPHLKEPTTPMLQELPLQSLTENQGIYWLFRSVQKDQAIRLNEDRR